MPVKTASATRRTRKSTTRKATTAKMADVKVAPPAPKLNLQDYKEDFRARMAIHNYEVGELFSDVIKVYHTVKPFVLKSVEYVKAAYQREFAEKTS